jgi:hypothetical protein
LAAAPGLQHLSITHVTASANYATCNRPPAVVTYIPAQSLLAVPGLRGISDVNCWAPLTPVAFADRPGDWTEVWTL